MTDLRPVKLYLSMEITRDKAKRILKLIQETAIEKILNQFEIINCRIINTLMKLSDHLTKTNVFYRATSKDFFSY